MRRSLKLALHTIAATVFQPRALMAGRTILGLEHHQLSSVCLHWWAYRSYLISDGRNRSKGPCYRDFLLVLWTVPCPDPWLRLLDIAAIFNNYLVVTIQYEKYPSIKHLAVGMNLQGCIDMSIVRQNVDFVASLHIV